MGPQDEVNYPKSKNNTTSPLWKAQNRPKTQDKVTPKYLKKLEFPPILQSDISLKVYIEIEVWSMVCNELQSEKGLRSREGNVGLTSKVEIMCNSENFAILNIAFNFQKTKETEDDALEMKGKIINISFYIKRKPETSQCGKDLGGQIGCTTCCTKRPVEVVCTVVVCILTVVV